MKTKILPDCMLTKMRLADRKATGQITSAEALAKAEARSEKDVQRQIANWLRLKGIWFSQSRTDKRTTNGNGCPDFIFSIPEEVNHPKPVALEVKFQKGQLSDDQKRVRNQMILNGWNYYVVRSLQEVIDLIRI